MAHLCGESGCVFVRNTAQFLPGGEATAVALKSFFTQAILKALGAELITCGGGDNFGSHCPLPPQLNCSCLHHEL